MKLPALFLACALCTLWRANTASAFSPHNPPVTPEILVSVPDQRLYVVQGSRVEDSFPASTSRFGLGDRPGCYGTPLGVLKVVEKLGQGARSGAVFRHRALTGEILRPNVAGRNCIVTRILRLAGTEPSNAHTYDRGVYIHGTTHESEVGLLRMSYGCIGMRSGDVIRLFDRVVVGTEVLVVNQPFQPKKTERSGHFQSRS